jgi:peroxiredoxin
MKHISTQSDFEQLINSDTFVVINVYRGSWCPFCKKYLNAFEHAFKKLPQGSHTLYGVSVDSEGTNSKLQKSLSLNFPLVSDAGQLFRSKLKNPVSTSHPQAKKTADGYFLQPAIYIYQEGELKYQWQHTSKLLNLGGAVGRIDAEDVVGEVKKLMN